MEERAIEVVESQENGRSVFGLKVFLNGKEIWRLEDMAGKEDEIAAFAERLRDPEVSLRHIPEMSEDFLCRRDRSAVSPD